jgi:hypothetical protein
MVADERALPTAMSRRRFLLALMMGAGGGALAACGGRAGTGEEGASPTGQAGDVAQAEATAAAGDLADVDLAEFLALSAVLTGFPRERLSPELGRIYLRSLQERPDPEVRLTDLYEQGGFRSSAPPESLEQLAETGLLDQEPRRTLADTVVEYWYTGVYDAGGEAAVATYTEALAWQALTWTVAPSNCQGAMGFWGEPPRGRG